ncbi:MAG: chemotaxis protein CheB [Methylococcales bacterium]|nr:chemotaxis protein CheB [Methylococcales bacterium]MDP3838516.1 chemotaxis protein CheB [Methylococcales bacterium]
MYKMLVIGLSAGGIPLVKRLLAALPKEYSLAVVVVAHLLQGCESHLAHTLGAATDLPVTMARDKELIVAGHIYVAPPDYHLRVEQKLPHTFSLSEDKPVKSVRPSIDVLFKSAAEAFDSSLIAVILSGANSDGADGMVSVKQLGGLCIVLDPLEAEFNTMPDAIIAKVDVDYVVGVEDMMSLLVSVDEK